MRNYCQSTRCGWFILGGWGHNANQKESWSHHQMETFSELLALCAGNSPVTGWVNSRDTDDLRRHRAHYAVIVMVYEAFHIMSSEQTGGPFAGDIFRYIFMTKYFRILISKTQIYSRHNYPYFCTFPQASLILIEIETYKVLCWNCNDSSMKMHGYSISQIHRKVIRKLDPDKSLR